MSNNNSTAISSILDNINNNPQKEVAKIIWEDITTIRNDIVELLEKKDKNNYMYRDLLYLMEPSLLINIFSSHKELLPYLLSNSKNIDIINKKYENKKIYGSSFLNFLFLQKYTNEEQKKILKIFDTLLDKYGEKVEYFKIIYCFLAPTNNSVDKEIQLKYLSIGLNTLKKYYSLFDFSVKNYKHINSNKNSPIHNVLFYPSIKLSLDKNFVETFKIVIDFLEKMIDLTVEKYFDEKNETRKTNINKKIFKKNIAKKSYGFFGLDEVMKKVNKTKSLSSEEKKLIEDKLNKVFNINEREKLKNMIGYELIIENELIKNNKTIQKVFNIDKNKNPFITEFLLTNVKNKFNECDFEIQRINSFSFVAKIIDNTDDLKYIKNESLVIDIIEKKIQEIYLLAEDLNKNRNKRYEYHDCNERQIGKEKISNMLSSIRNDLREVYLKIELKDLSNTLLNNVIHKKKKV